MRRDAPEPSPKTRTQGAMNQRARECPRRKITRTKPLKTAFERSYSVPRKVGRERTVGVDLEDSRGTGRRTGKNFEGRIFLIGAKDRRITTINTAGSFHDDSSTRSRFVRTSGREFEGGRTPRGGRRVKSSSFFGPRQGTRDTDVPCRLYHTYFYTEYFNINNICKSWSQPECN